MLAGSIVHLWSVKLYWEKVIMGPLNVSFGSKG